MATASDGSPDDPAIAERRRFLGIAQHTLKTPLAVISGWSATLQKWELLSPQERNGGLVAINRAVDDLQRQVDDLFEEAHLHLLLQSLSPVDIDLAEFLEEQALSRGADPARHPIRCTVPAGACVRADRGALGHVVRHLLDNAVTYSPEGGAIDISAEILADAVVVAVEDHGIGLPPAEDDIFEPFRRGRPSAKIRRGTGLGLHVVRSLVAGMGGEVAAAAGSDGAVFRITLPRCGTRRRSGELGDDDGSVG